MALDVDKFNSVSDLYKRVLPALQTKREELKRDNFKIDNLDIWNFCVETKWKFKSDLRMYELVDDILNVDIKLFENYLNNKIK